MDLAMFQDVHHLTEGRKHLLTSQESCHSIQPALTKSNAADQYSVGSCWIGFDTAEKVLPAGLCPDKPCIVGKHPKSARHEWLEYQPELSIDKAIHNRSLASGPPGRYL